MKIVNSKIQNPDYVALGLGGTGMMGMLWTIAMGKTAIGVEMRGDPHLGVHWNIREDLYHQLHLIDVMMERRYGKSGIPKRENGELFKLAPLFYSPHTQSGDIVADEIISGYTPDEHIVGTIQHVEFIDDRSINGKPSRKVHRLTPPKPPREANVNHIRENVRQVLDGPSTFQASAEAVLTLLRRYLEALQDMDQSDGKLQRVALYTHHRVVEDPQIGFPKTKDGKRRIVIEELQELDMNGKFIRVRSPGSAYIDLGVPELFTITQGFNSKDAASLGFQQKEVVVDHNDGHGPRVAQADYLAGLVEILVDGRLRRRIASEYDAKGREYWTRQIAVGHENDPEVGWVLVQVPEFVTFDPIQAGFIDKDTDPKSPEYYAAYQKLVHDFFVQETAKVLDMKEEDIRKAPMVYGPKMFTLVEKMGDAPQVAKNGLVAGDSFGNGHFMTSGGAMTGMIGHSSRILEYWKMREKGISASQAILRTSELIKNDTQDWLEASATEFSGSMPVNFGKERVLKLKNNQDEIKRTHIAARKKRHGLAPLNLSDWRRPLLRPGKVWSKKLPKINPLHPSIA